MIEFIIKGERTRMGVGLDFDSNWIELVRCKDCKYRQNDVGMGDHCWCDIVNGSRLPDDYCSYGVRRNNG